LFYDRAFGELAESAGAIAGKPLLRRMLPWENGRAKLQDFIRGPASLAVETQRIFPEQDIAFFFHTSGTSTGLPKAIPQTHRGAVGVLPSLDNRFMATFTTTPLYHGGIADCLRSWTSSSMIWLFPAAHIPITSNNILSCIECANQATKGEIPSVSYFASVPYILQMLADSKPGLEMLKTMSIVSVGGAALPQNIGDDLVNHGINLVSRFGSAECGFLLSSHRLYDKDKEWDYLRLPTNNKSLRFEQEEKEPLLFQLVVLPTWPHVAKFNRPDGSFATGDVFEPHPTLPYAWKYHSRNDSQITLSTGKKFDPAPLEDVISASSPFIADVLIFGNGRDVPGALIFPAEEEEIKAGAEFEEVVWDIIRGINAQGQDHTRIARDMVVILPKDVEPLPKSSKGTLLRNVAYERLGKQINAVYNIGFSTTDGDVLTQNSSKREVLKVVRKVVQTVAGGRQELGDDSDFYRHGVDSALCTRIRGRLQKVVGERLKLPWSIVYDCGSISA
jgi:acyl-CoA synthetase (AMP-forming)/AMP-acid ligase II